MTKITLSRMTNFLNTRSGLTKGIAKLSSGVAGAQLISLLVYPILTRVYNAEAFGVLGVYTAIVGLVVMVSTLRYDMAIPLPNSRQGALAVVSVAIHANLIVVLLFLAIGALFPSVFELLGEGDIPAYFIWLVPLGILLGGSYKCWRMWAVREKAYGTIATTRMTQALASSAVQVGLGFVHPTGVSLVTARMLGSGVGIGTIIKRTIVRRSFHFPKPAETLSAGRTYWRFAVMGAPAALLNSLALNMPSILLASLYGVAVVGQFSLAMLVIGVPGTLIGGSVETAFYAEAARLGKDNGVEIRRMVRQLTKRLAIIGAVPAIALAIFGPILFTFVFGSEWHQAGVFASYLTIFMFLNMLSMPFSSIFLIHNKLHISFLLNALKAFLAVGAFVIPGHFASSATTTILIYALALGFFYFVYGLTARLTLAREIRNRTPEESDNAL